MFIKLDIKLLIESLVGALLCTVVLMFCTWCLIGAPSYILPFSLVYAPSFIGGILSFALNYFGKVEIKKD